ncbi:MAG: sodium-dependent transporter, partial [Oscillospiraceae bacterium]|nr:sodium-dependent transporter [Oscillospiraceae bacterium]
QDLLDVYDLITEGIMMPLAAMLTCIVVGWKIGMPWIDEEMEQEGNKFYCKKFFAVCVKYVTPVMMAFVFVALVTSYVSF